MASDISEDICVRFGNRVRRLRERRDWSITYLGVHSGLAKTFVHDVERGKKEPCLRTIEVLAKSFDLTVSQLMKGL